MRSFTYFLCFFSILIISLITCLNIYNSKRPFASELNGSLSDYFSRRCKSKQNISSSIAQINILEVHENLKYTQEYFPNFSSFDLNLLQENLLTNTSIQKQNIPQYVFDPYVAKLLGISVAINSENKEKSVLEENYKKQLVLNRTFSVNNILFKIDFAPNIDTTKIKEKHQNDSDFFPAVCDDFACYKEFLSPSISYKVLKRCFSGKNISNTNNSKQILNFWPLKYRFISSSENRTLYLYENNYGMNIFSMIMQKFKENSESLIKNQQFKMINELNFNKSVALLLTDLNYKARFFEFDIDGILDLHKMIFNNSLFHFLQSEKRDSHIQQLLHFFSNYCRYKTESRLKIVSLNADQSFCCEMTAANLAIKQLNTLTTENILNLAETFFDHCFEPSQEDIAKTCIQCEYLNTDYPGIQHKNILNQPKFIYGFFATYR
ncbi:hypothetical protein EDEG_03109 [Edhazardia aedis USNM 41457]|uniref:Uncharacterized protein n=1 Tax=Edhazardia aedis (strain USNM 41457) TaxID=1003232 RepID=J9D4K9_EDHAE|nr:hypothetical protein EDEG_03109 [Edhazardia aedis USNM 41457]|eukprot:EJW02489.1 hypothetical protein EDEG_03109 [Edhazardia aedis USNM 41457]